MQWIPAVTVRLPYPVSANRYWRTRVITPKSGPPIVSTYVSAEAKKFRTQAEQLLRAAGVREVIHGRLRVDLQLHPHCPKDWKTRMRKDPLWWADTVKRLDLDNSRKVVLDALKGVAIVDDVQVWKDTGEVMEPRPEVEACIVVRICRVVVPQVQQQLDCNPT